MAKDCIGHGRYGDGCEHAFLHNMTQDKTQHPRDDGDEQQEQHNDGYDGPLVIIIITQRHVLFIDSVHRQQLSHK